MSSIWWGICIGAGAVLGGSLVIVVGLYFGSISSERASRRSDAARKPIRL